MYTLNKKDLSFVLRKKSNIVITGDSLAYNKYDFIKGPRTNAYDCYIGMESWSFLLRNFIIKNQIDFISGRDLLFNDEIDYEYFSNSKFDSLVPFIYEGICIDMKKDQNIKITNIKNGFLYVLTDKNFGGSIKIDSEVFNVTGDINKFLGYDIKLLPIKDGNIACISESVRLNIIGFSSVGSNVFLSGKGSITTKWLYDNLEERVLKYKPDLLIMIIGANDRNHSNVSEAYESMKKIIDNINCEILLISTPHSSTTDPNNNNIYVPDEMISKPLLDNIYKIVNKNSIPFIDLFKFFNGVESKVWRFDNIHFTIAGNKILYNYIIKAFFGGNI